jgi:ABC-type polysaccharide/polyol phosphate transport system ATPase subunit
VTAISIKNVDVRIPIYDSQSLRLLKLPSFGRARVGTQDVSHVGGTLIIHALSNLSLDFTEGDRVCVIGHNGAGKTTLLRLIAGIYPPSSGTIHVAGKVYALLGNMTMSNPEATGYENIRMAANLYGWPQDQIANVVRDIEDFTELGEYLALPTRVYSAGMQARLAFALGTVQSPDILVVDEGIGAGDAAFRDRAEKRVKNFMSRAKIIVLASHSTELCRSVCNKALLLVKGRQVFFGDIDEGFQRYAEQSSI